MSYVTVKSALKFLAEPNSSLSRALIYFPPFHPLLSGVFRAAEGGGGGGGHLPLLDTILPTTLKLPNKTLTSSIFPLMLLFFIIPQVHPHLCKMSAYSPAYSCSWQKNNKVPTYMLSLQSCWYAWLTTLGPASCHTKTGPAYFHF